MSPPPYMKLYWGDYFRDTPHLTRSQHGAYLLLIAALWNNGGKIAADDATLARFALCTSSEWEAMKAVVLPFFKVQRGKLTHKRIGAELAKYESTIGKRKQAGKTGSKVTNGKRKGSGAANAEHLPTVCRHNQNQNQRIEEGGIDTPSSIRRASDDERADGSSSPRSVVDFEELKLRIQREAQAMADARRLA